jgi:hypothetical protein
MTMLKIGHMRLAWLATAAAILAIALAFTTVDSHQQARAGGSCSKQCSDAFAACYKESGANRSACDEAKSICMEQCVKNGG